MASVNTVRIPSSNVMVTPHPVSGRNSVSRSTTGMSQRSRALTSLAKLLAGYDSTEPLSSMLWNVRMIRKAVSMQSLGVSDRVYMSQIALEMALRRI